MRASCSPSWTTCRRYRRSACGTPPPPSERPALSSPKVVQVTDDLSAVLGQPDLVFAVLCVPTDQAAALARQVLGAGRHLLAEKPVGMTRREIAELEQTAAVVWHDLNPRLQVESPARGRRAAVREATFVLPPSTSYGGAGGETFCRHFIAATAGRGKPPTTLADALRSSRIVEAAEQSSRTGQFVPIDPSRCP